MLTGLRNAVINGGTFVHTSTLPTSEGFKILRENIASGAFHDSGERFDAPKCHPNTRVAVLADIMQWIQDIEESEDVLWLYGPAGAGKSAIVQTIAEMCAKLGLLVTSFFFFRASQTRNNKKCLIASIAYQLALSIPATRLYVESAVQTDPAIFDKSLDTQMETLIIRPLENARAVVTPAVAKQWPRLIVVDGLDECHDPSIQCSIIRVLSAALLRIPLILLVASRPEPHIRKAFNLLHKSHASRHIVLDDSYKPDADIKEFLLSRFNEIKENHQLAAYIPKSWPSVEIIDRLVGKSSGQFIYASTVMKYVDSPNHRPMKRLEVVIGLTSVNGDVPFKELDTLYSHIFSSVEDLATSLKILGFSLFVHGTGPITPDLLAHLLALDEEDIHLCLSELHSLLYIPPPNTSKSIRPVHASLQDFLVDKLRSGKYYFDEEAFHTDLAQQSVRQILALSMNTIGHSSPGLFSRREAYLISNFIYLCTHPSTDSAILKNDLMQLRDLRPWFEIKPPKYEQNLPFLFEWLYKADTANKEVSRHIQSLWDQYLTTKLNEHTFNGSNVDVAGLLFFPPIWDSRWFSLISGVSQPPDVVRWEAADTVFPFIDEEPYRHMIVEFFEDKSRSGKYHVDGRVYAHAALECFRNMFNSNDDEIFNPYPFILGIERPDAKLFMLITEGITSKRDTLVPSYREGLDAVLSLLSKAAPLTELYFHLRDHPLQNPAKAKVHYEHGFASLRLAVKVYLDKCKHLRPKVLRRSASYPPYFPYVDLELECLTFNQRWPLAGDISSIRLDDLKRRSKPAMRRILAIRDMRLRAL